MSGGTLMVWLPVCSASIGVPAAIRPITGTATGRLPSSSEPELRTLPSVPSMTLGVKPRRPLPLPLDEISGSLITSMARARLGRRRMKPRSSSAVMRRWIPDFERRSSASFISSKEGGTPDSFRRSLMNRRSSYCLRVSISTNPQVDSAVRFQDSEIAKAEAGSSFKELQTPLLETNHEQTLYVPYVFRNHLISGQRDNLRRNPARQVGHIGSRRISQGDPASAAGAKGGRITSARAAARFANSELSWWSTGVASSAPSLRTSRRARR